MYRNIVYYNAPDQSGALQLWATDGTSAGTFEVTPGFSPLVNGLDPLYLIEYNNKLMFEGQSVSGKFGLWVSNGTAAGTSELGGLGSTGINGANPDGLGPGPFIVYNGKVLFRGEAGTSGHEDPGLWITDGTVAGTSEIGGIGNTGIAGALTGAPGFLRDVNVEFTLFGGKVLFSAADAANNQGLWVTDGTAAGTSELAPINGAMTVGSPGSDVLGSGGNMAVLGNMVLFRGNDQQDTPGSLWVTDGTAGGTSEIGGQGNAGISGSPNGFTGQFTSEAAHGMYPTDLTTFNGKVVFAAFDDQLDNAGYYVPSFGLWVSDGTAGGTTEVGGQGSTGIVGAYHADGIPSDGGGIFDSDSGITNPDFTVYNNRVLFVGMDTSGHVGLWSTDGTAGGTSEIGGIEASGITAGGGLVLSGTNSPDFTVYNGVVLFNGHDFNTNHSELWVTDGTAAGTHIIATPNDFGLPNSVLGPDFTIGTAPPADNFNSNNTSDILFRNSSSGDTWFEAMSNGGSNGWNQIGGSDTHYSVVGVGDCYGTGTSDILFRNSSSGDTWFEAMSNGAFAGWHEIGGSNTSYTAYGAGDFYGNGVDDPLFRNTSTGDTWFESLSNGASTGWQQVGGSDTHYAIVGMGDFNGNDYTDILFRNNSSGDTWFEAMSNGKFAGWQEIGGSDTHYSVVGVGDFYGNGESDILFRNNTTGDTWFESMSNGVATGWHQVGGSDTTYSVAGIGDYFGNNTSDILFRNSAGDTWFEGLSNGAFAGWNQVGGSSTSYSVPLNVGPPAL
jgi:ELWxxDGT repeat protein